MNKPIILFSLILVIALNIIFYNTQSAKILHISQFLIETICLISFFYILLNLQKSPYTKWIQIMIFGVFISLFRWWNESFVITKFLTTYNQDFYNQYGQYFFVIAILLLGAFTVKKLELFNKSNL